MKKNSNKKKLIITIVAIILILAIVARVIIFLNFKSYNNENIFKYENQLVNEND